MKESNLTRRYYDIKNVMIQAGLISFKGDSLVMMHEDRRGILSGTKVLRNKLHKQLKTIEKDNQLKAERVRELRHFVSTLDRFKRQINRKRQGNPVPKDRRLNFPLLFINYDTRQEATVELTPNGHFLKAHGHFLSFKTELDIAPDLLTALEEEEVQRE